MQFQEIRQLPASIKASEQFDEFTAPPEYHQQQYRALDRR